MTLLQGLALEEMAPRYVNHFSFFFFFCMPGALAIY